MDDTSDDHDKHAQIPAAFRDTERRSTLELDERYAAAQPGMPCVPATRTGVKAGASVMKTTTLLRMCYLIVDHA